MWSACSVELSGSTRSGTFRRLNLNVWWINVALYAGLGFFYGGFVSEKAVVNTIMLSFGTMGVITVLWGESSETRSLHRAPFRLRGQTLDITLAWCSQSAALLLSDQKCAFSALDRLICFSVWVSTISAA